jgi:FKBP-type peptidyl-prolyl cis-trans isomerase
MKINLSNFGIVGVLFSLVACLGDSNTPSFQEQLLQEVAAIDSYLASKGITAIKEASSGIRFTLDSLGSGYSPRINDRVTFAYTGKLMDMNGTVFQSATISNTSINSLITGFQIGLTIVPNGSKATLYIPSVYAFGSQAQTGIPANSNLIFNIKLKSITTVAAEKTQLPKDTVIIRSYLTKAAITNTVKDTSGLRFVITQPGNGPTPTWLNKVDITYTGYLIAASGEKGDKIFTGTNKPAADNDNRVANFIRGFQIGLQKMPKGSKATFYIPSVLAFGPQSPPGALVPIPPNSNLIYEVELNDVLQP